MITKEQHLQFGDILDELGGSLDITETQHSNAVRSYESVGSLLAKEGSILAPYGPEILPQGSFMLGTMVRPDTDCSDLDIDLVCQLAGKNPAWTQARLKQIVGEQIRSNELYKSMLSEGRRCWTLEYSEKATYHLDVLPSIVSNGYKLILEKSFSAVASDNFEQLAIRITDKKGPTFLTSTNPEEWPKSNPFGYGRWFFNRASIGQTMIRSFSESIKPVPKRETKKLVLQRVVQILKRHRDIFFGGDDDKPISIIITTLAARAYGGEDNIAEALINAVNMMPSYLSQTRFVPELSKETVWIGNPVNEEENFADKWPDHPKREANFRSWVQKVKVDMEAALGQVGLPQIQESLERPFGQNAVRKAFSRYGENQRILRESGMMKMTRGSGILGITGDTPVKQHTFFGND